MLKLRNRFYMCIVCDFILYNYVISDRINGLDTRFTFL